MMTGASKNTERRALLLSVIAGVVAAGCTSTSSGVDEIDVGAPPDAAPPAPDAHQPMVEAICDDDTSRAVLPGPFSCAAPPETIAIETRTGRYEIFKYEASHPLATDVQAFPCAQTRGKSYGAPDEAAEACSRAGVRPWHSVTWFDAQAACEEIGWRLCTGEELTRACEGPGANAYTWGGAFDPSKCNLREAYVPEGETFAGEAPTGKFDGCVSEDGVFDLSGNLWEWNSDSDEQDDRTRYYQGAGWRTIAERHRESDLMCAARTRLPGISAASYANSDVGFRCCRYAP